MLALAPEYRFCEYDGKCYVARELYGCKSHRIVDAFWRLMGEMPYRGITIRGLCFCAGVNPNTFYSYFGCMDELAKDAFEESLVPGFPALIMHVISGGAREEDVEAVAADAHVAHGLGRMLLLGALRFR